MDFAQLAGEITLFLSPVIPYLHKSIILGGKKAIESLGEKGGEYSWDIAKKIWSKLKKKMKRNKNLKKSVSILAIEPNNKDALFELKSSLELYLRQDPAFANELRSLIGNLPETVQKTDVKDSKMVNVTQYSIGGGDQTAKIKDSEKVIIRQTKE